MSLRRLSLLLTLTIATHPGCAMPGTQVDPLTEALLAAGDNRHQLQEALAHYEDGDPLKYDAMVFLIENMPGHGFAEMGFFTEEDEVDFDALEYACLSEAEAAFGKLGAEFGDMNYRKRRFAPDLEVITAEYLIENVELAFEAWRTKPWARDMTFDTFCQHILPYRGSNEPLDHWRGSMMEFFADLEHEVEDPTDAGAAARVIEAQAHDWVGFWDLYYLHPTDQSFGEMMSSGKGRCEDITNMISYGLRANAVAVGSDYTPAWANRDNNHAWTTVLGPDGRGHTPQGNIAAKVYRKTFALQRDAWPYRAAEGEAIPRWLARDHFIDVTDQYLEAVDVEVEFTAEAPAGTRLAYLCVFNGGDWIAVAAAERKGNKATFRDMGPGALYLPAFYDGADLIPAAPPFLLESTGPHRLGWVGDGPGSIISISALSQGAYDPDKKEDIRSITFQAGKTYRVYSWQDGWSFHGDEVADEGKQHIEMLQENVLYWVTEVGGRRLERPFAPIAGEIRHF